MITGDISQLGLFDALHLCEFLLATGTLRSSSASKSGLIYLDKGRISFAELEGRQDATIDVERSGIDPRLWHRIVSMSPNGAAASTLIDLGAEPDAVRRFVRRRIDNVVAELALLDDSHLDMTPEPGWFGAEITHSITSVVDAARVINFGGELVGDSTTDALVALCPTDANTVTLGTQEWNVIAELIGAVDLANLRSRVGGREATAFVRFLQSRSLATAVVAMPGLE
ncbi:MAG: hypothetical protein OEX04_19020 [Acidimicrobiia bacterium]|nr:hypothetical protein [Acidimicrobiia bacterium]MDH4309567.1 hypothetical protein [Acidimicrobiia bacterium]MDH5295189.1 hypothetical protein [Acidimicrobiia bacterium]